jgi:hypothetical protein
VASRTKRILGALAIAAGLALVAANLWSIMTRVKEPTYSLQQRDGDFEVRTYGPRVVAETVVQGQWGESGNEGFRRLAGYIFGKSTTRAKIAMTAPVGQREETRKIAMTAPVGQRAGGDGWVVSFTMPEGETLDSLPQPIDSSVVLRELPATRFAVVRFSGRWSDKKMLERTEALRAWAKSRGLLVVGEPEVNRYDPPWTLWFLRRNEVWLALEPNTTT